MTTLAKWQYMVFSRMFAMAELGWTPAERRDFTDFKERLDKHKPFLDALKTTTGRTSENRRSRMPK